MRTPIIAPEQVHDLLNSEPIVLIDASFGPHAKNDYLTEHLAGAIWVDLNTQLSAIGPDPAVGGRHPLPSPEHFSTTLGYLGVTPAHRVLVYDRSNGALAAARCWWMISALGHEDVHVIDGGFQAMKALGLPMSSGEERLNPQPPYPSSSWTLPVLSMTEVEAAIAKDAIRLIDMRESERFQGKREPIDQVAGHIPTAQNIPYMQNLDDAGRFKSVGALRHLYKDMATENVAFYCGSGVTACHGIIAMAQAGFGIATLYPGSWSEWSRNEHDSSS